jgi:hypothetical protein
VRDAGKLRITKREYRHPATPELQKLYYEEHKKGNLEVVG